MDGPAGGIRRFQPYALPYPQVRDAELGRARWLCRDELLRMTGCRQGDSRLASVSNDGQKVPLGNEAPALRSERELRRTEVNFKTHSVTDLDRTQLSQARSVGERVRASSWVDLILILAPG